MLVLRLMFLRMLFLLLFRLGCFLLLLLARRALQHSGGPCVGVVFRAFATELCRKESRRNLSVQRREVVPMDVNSRSKFLLEERPGEPQRRLHVPGLID